MKLTKVIAIGFILSGILLTFFVVTNIPPQLPQQTDNTLRIKVDMGDINFREF